MSEPAQHTPIPWRTEYGFIGTERRLFVVAPGMDGLLPASDADAELIVRAVNSHAELLALCEESVRFAAALCGNKITTTKVGREKAGDVFTRLKAAVAKAKGDPT
ncbi:MAG TPA: hypothetical protein VGE74_24235 [Gemmata sp.]